MTDPRALAASYLIAAGVMDDATRARLSEQIGISGDTLYFMARNRNLTGITQASPDQVNAVIAWFGKEIGDNNG